MNQQKQQGFDLRASLKKAYLKNQSIPHLIEFKGSNNNRLSLNDNFINLQLVQDKNQTISRQISVHEIFKGYQNGGQNLIKAIIRGGPGSGKSTLMNKIAYEWARSDNKNTNKQFKTFQNSYIFRINLKKITQTDKIKFDYNKQKIFLELIYCSVFQGKSVIQKDQFDKMMGNFFNSTNPRDIIILLDGYDEVLHLQKKDQVNSLKQIYQFAKKYNVVITSRPNAVQISQWLKQFQRIILIKGLNQDSIINFINKFFPQTQQQKKQVLKNEIKNNKSLLKMLESPLNLTMACILLQKQQKNLVNQFFLYDKIIKLLCKRYSEQRQNKTDPQAKINMDRKLKNPYILIQPINKLKKLILQAFVKKDKITFSYNFLFQQCNYLQSQTKNLTQFGLLKMIDNNEKDKIKNENGENQQNISYQFIHWSFGQFLIAHSIYQKLKKFKLDAQYIQYAKLIAQKRYEPKYFNIFRYLIMIAVSEYNTNEQKYALEIYWVALTSNIDSVLQFGDQNRLSLFMEMISLCKIYEKTYKNQTKLLLQNVKKFIVDKFRSQQNPFNGYIKYYTFIINSKYLPAEIVQDLLKKIEEIMKKLMKKSNQTDKQYEIITQENEMIKIYCQITSKLIYLQEIPQKRLSIVKVFFNLLQIDQKFMRIKIVSLTNMLTLLTYLPDDDIKTIIDDQKKMNKLYQLLLKKESHQIIFEILIYLFKQISQQKKRDTMQEKLVGKLQGMLFQNKQQISSRILLKQISDNRITTLQAVKAVKAARQKYLKQIIEKYQKKEYECTEKSDHKQINTQIKSAIVNILQFQKEDKDFLQRNGLNIQKEKLIKYLDKQSTMHQCLIVDGKLQNQYYYYKEIIKELIQIKDQQQFQESFYYNESIPNGYGKYLKKQTAILNLLQKYSIYLMDQHVILILSFIDGIFTYSKLKDNQKIWNRIINVVQQLIKSQAKKQKQKQKRNIIKTFVKFYTKRWLTISQNLKKTNLNLIFNLLQKQKNLSYQLRYSSGIFFKQKFNNFSQDNKKLVQNRMLELLNTQDSKKIQIASYFLAQKFNNFSQDNKKLVLNRMLELLNTQDSKKIQNAKYFLKYNLNNFSQDNKKLVQNRMLELLNNQDRDKIQIASYFLAQKFNNFSQDNKKLVLNRMLELLNNQDSKKIQIASYFLAQKFNNFSQDNKKLVLNRMLELLNTQDSKKIQIASYFLEQNLNNFSQDNKKLVQNRMLELLNNQDRDKIQIAAFFLAQNLNNFSQDNKKLVLNRMLELLNNQDRDKIQIAAFFLEQNLNNFSQFNKNIMIDFITKVYNKIKVRVNVMIFFLKIVNKSRQIPQQLIKLINSHCNQLSQKKNISYQQIDLLQATFHISNWRNNKQNLKNFLLAITRQKFQSKYSKISADCLKFIEDQNLSIIDINKQLSNNILQINILKTNHNKQESSYLIQFILRSNASKEAIEYFVKQCLKIQLILTNCYKQIIDLLKKYGYLSHLIAKTLKQKPNEFIGQNYIALIQMAKVNPLMNEAVQAIYKEVISKTYDKINEEIRSSLQEKQSNTFTALKKLLNQDKQDKQEKKDKQDKKVEKVKIDIKSFFAQEMLKTLIKLLLQDYNLSIQDSKFIKQCIKAEISVVFSYHQEKKSYQHGQYSYSITVNNVEYPIENPNDCYFSLLQELFKETAEGKRYALHDPLFINDGKHGFQIASIDRKDIKEIFINHKEIKTDLKDEQLIIDWNKIIILYFIEPKTQYYLIIRRDQFGFISVTKLSQKQKNPRQIIFNPKQSINEQKLLDFKEGIIGKVQVLDISVHIYDNVKSVPKAISLEQVKQITKKQVKKILNIPKWKLLYQQKPQKIRLQQVEQKVQFIYKINGYKLKIQIQNQLQRLCGDNKQNKSKIQQYSRIVFWNIYNIVAAFGAASTGIVNGNRKYNGGDQKIVKDYLLKLPQIISKNSELFPIFGSQIKKITQIIINKFKQRQQRQFDNNISVFKQLFQKKKIYNGIGQFQNREILIQQICLQLIRYRKQIIINGQKEKYANQLMQFFENLSDWKTKFNQIGVQQKLKSNQPDQLVSILAMKDTIVLVTSIINNKDEIINRNRNGEQIPKEIIQYFKKKQKQNGQSNCGTRFMTCLNLYLCGCCCCEKKPSEQSCSDKIKRFWLACFCCFPQKDSSQSNNKKKIQSSSMQLSLSSLNQNLLKEQNKE